MEMVHAKQVDKPQPGEMAKVAHNGPVGSAVMYLPRWSTDHHPWVQHGQPGIRYANFEVERD